ncbi:MAG: hypothetical protein JO219_10640 [Candidatus Eremiobacteraeota bacterium]|nr:hypothetical protein [Candidatus Eremiobacteraeota bacterium]
MTNANRKRQLAIETAAKEGLRASVPLYVAAAEAFAQEDRPAQGLELLGELLRAKEKRRGLFGRVDKNPLGPERVRVATKYAELAHLTSPTEDSLETLSDLAIEFSDVAVVRRANADGLRNAGYAADAIDEYRTCAKLEPNEGDIPVRLSELYAALGRADDAREQLRTGITLHAANGQFEQVADRAMRFIDLNPDELDDVFDSMELIPGEVLKKHVPSLDHLGVLVRRDPSREPAWRARTEQRLVELYTRVLEADARNGAARRGINVLGPQYLTEVENKLRTAPKPAAATAAVSAAAVSVGSAAATATVAPPRATPAAPPSTTPMAPPIAPPPALEDAAGAPELVEKSPGELVAEDEPVAAAPAPASASTPAPGAKPAESASAPAQPAQPAAAATAAGAAPTRAQEPVAPATQSPAPAAAAVSAEAASAAPKTPSSALYAFALRKAQEQFDAGHYSEAAQACDRILKRGEIPEVLMLLSRCYLKQDLRDEAVAACMRYADAQGAIEPAKALDALTDFVKELPDPALILRRSQLLTTIRQVERVS